MDTGNRVFIPRLSPVVRAVMVALHVTHAASSHSTDTLHIQ